MQTHSPPPASSNPQLKIPLPTSAQIVCWWTDQLCGPFSAFINFSLTKREREREKGPTNNNNSNNKSLSVLNRKSGFAPYLQQLLPSLSLSLSPLNECPSSISLYRQIVRPKAALANQTKALPREEGIAQSVGR